MSEQTQLEEIHSLFLGSIEPQAPLLKAPPNNQLLYKIVSVENLLRSIRDSYLYFNRIDCYRDFPGADLHDGKQLPRDYKGNASTKFLENPEFSVANYYEQSRTRTYACCFSLENSDYIWNNYANGSEKGKVCLVFNFDKLRERINRSLQRGKASLNYNGIQCHQIFSVNYGIVEYVDVLTYQANIERLPNPITYMFMKDKRFEKEKELRISLSACGIGQFMLNESSRMVFQDNLQLSFDFKTAILEQTLQQILVSNESSKSFLEIELKKLGI